MTRSRFLTSASKFNIGPNGEIFDISPENDCASLNVKPPHRCTLSRGGPGSGSSGGSALALRVPRLKMRTFVS